MFRVYFREFSCQDIYWFETSKNDHCKCGNWGCKCPCLQVNVPFPKNKKWPFIPRMTLLFSRVALLFSRSALLFPRSVFLFNVCVSFKCFFPGDCTFYLSCSELLRAMLFALLLKPLYGVWFLIYFIQVWFSMIAWKMQFLSI